MNSGIPDWCFEFDPPSTKKNMGPDHDLVELLWQNGQVVLHSQTNRKPSPNRSDDRQPYRHDDPVARAGLSSGNARNPIPDEGMVSWIHYPVANSFEKELCSQFLGELPLMDIDKPTKQVEQEKAVNFRPFSSSSQQHNMRNTAVPVISGGQMPPPRFQFPNPTWQVYDNSPGGSGKIVNFSQFAPTLKGETRPPSFQIGGRQGSGILSQVNVRECSVTTVGSSQCGSNQIPNDFPDQRRASSNGVGMVGGVSAGLLKEEDCNILPLSQTEGRRSVTLEPTLTSSSGGSGSSLGATAKQCVDVSIGHNLKGREGEEPECQSEALEIESASGKKLMRSGGSTRRNRVAEVHNLSERRRRERINKKMNALQELIPNCNKTDKASMLDEAIKYLKSLQLQLQVMWMGGGMAPMMFPGAQHYVSSMGMTMCPSAVPAVHPNMHMPMIPRVDQSFLVAQSMSQGMFGQMPVMNPMSFQNHMANPSFSEQFARYMALHNIQTQPADMFKFGCQGARQNQTNCQPSGNSAPYSGGATDGAPG